MMEHRCLISLAALAASVSMATSASADGVELPPPYVGVYQPQGVDEIGMWQEDDEREKALAASPFLIRDETLVDYVKNVLCKTVGNDRCNSVRVYIIREPVFNATMSPNGTMRVFSGLLLRVRSEAELGYVLGHEFGHFENRHSLNDFKRTRTGTDILAWGAVLAGFANSREFRRHSTDLRVSVYGSLFRYRRNQEREADAFGVSYLNQSPLRPQAASRVWANLMEEAEASASVRGLKKPNFRAIAFTASHPPHKERVDNLSSLADPEAYGRSEGREKYKELLDPWLPLLLEDQIKLNDFGATEYILERLALDGWTAPLLFARGELYRTRGAPRDHVFATEFYAEAIELDDTVAEAHRGLGLSLMKTGKRSDGQKSLQRYLDLKPEAKDARMIQMMLPNES